MVTLVSIFWIDGWPDLSYRPIRILESWSFCSRKSCHKVDECDYIWYQLLMSRVERA